MKVLIRTIKTNAFCFSELHCLVNSWNYITVPNNVFIDKTFVQLKKYYEDIKLSETHFLLNN